MLKKKRWSRNININIILLLTFTKSVLQDIKTYHNTTVEKKSMIWWWHRNVELKRTERWLEFKIKIAFQNSWREDIFNKWGWAEWKGTLPHSIYLKNFWCTNNFKAKNATGRHGWNVYVISAWGQPKAFTKQTQHS